MSTGKKSFAEQAQLEQGHQRESNLMKVIQHLPARSKDNLLLLILLVMGLSGFAYIFTLPLGKHENRRSLYEKIFHPQEEKALTSDFIKSNLLHVKGELLSNLPTIFSFDGLDKNELYQISYGDKIIANVDALELSHTYSTPGTYKIELRKERHGQSFVVHCEYLTIK